MLPDLINGLTDGRTKCYVAGNENFMVYRLTQVDGTIQHYQVCFDMYRPRGPTDRLVMYVQSAYVKDMPQAADRKHERVFATICAALMGALPTKPKGPRSKGKKKNGPD